MLASERTSAQELESLLTSFNAGWYRKPSIVNNLKKTLPINKNSYTHNLQEQQQQIKRKRKNKHNSKLPLVLCKEKTT